MEHRSQEIFSPLNMRIGLGTDVHAFVHGRPCIIGGVHIDHSQGLDGHSDADVLLHAIADALLSAARVGDIGKLFPDTDGVYKGANSMELLSIVADKVHKSGFTIIDIDCVIEAQAPKLSPHRDAMRKNVSTVLNIDIDRVGIKATTTEHLGYVGREEGIYAQAVALLYKQ